MAAPATDKIILVAPNAGTRMGGEALKAFHYFQWLLDNGHDAILVTHGRNRDALAGRLPPERIRWIDETPMQAALWRSRVLRPALSVYFHRHAASVARQFDRRTTLVHYICPISPVTLRFPPRGYRVVMGPLNGNIGHPPAFRHRVGRQERMLQVAYPLIQKVYGAMFGDKRSAETILVSGGARTRDALRLAGVADARMVDVLDAGVPMDLAALPPARHAGRNPEFVALGRFDAYKAYDLTLRAIAVAERDIRITIYGHGPERPRYEALAQRLGIADRVLFAGWLPHERLSDLRRFRGFVFPTLAEANGMVMQEAMMLGLPVLAVRWGGPSLLADDATALFLEPDGEDTVVAGLAGGLNRLAADAEFATRIGSAARAHAVANFGWDAVARTWAGHYRRPAVADSP